MFESPVLVRPHPFGRGVQRLYRFPNGFGASVVNELRPAMSGDRRLELSTSRWELSVVKWQGEKFHLCFTTPVAGDICDQLDEDEVEALLKQIAELKGGGA